MIKKSKILNTGFEWIKVSSRSKTKVYASGSSNAGKNPGLLNNSSNFEFPFVFSNNQYFSKKIHFFGYIDWFSIYFFTIILFYYF